jgi:hypothetical protein
MAVKEKTFVESYFGAFNEMQREIYQWMEDNKSRVKVLSARYGIKHVEGAAENDHRRCFRVKYVDK